MLWMITDFTKTPDVEKAYTYISKMINAGVNKVLLRNKSLIFNEKMVYQLAGKLAANFPENEIFVPESPSIAEMSGANAIHLPSTALLLIKELRETYPDFLISVSTHSLKEFEKAFIDGADYAFYSPIFPPISKPDDRRKNLSPIKRKNLYLLGGIDKIAALSLIEKGFTNLAGISLFYEENAAETVEFLTNRIEEKENDKNDSD